MKVQSQNEFSPCFSKCGLQTSSIFITWKLKMQTFKSHPRPPKSESNSHRIPRWLMCTWA